jgi:hypothetical protein
MQRKRSFRLEVLKNLNQVFVGASLFKIGCEIVIFLSASYPRRGCSHICVFMYVDL